LIVDEESRKAILKMMFGKSAEIVEKYLPEILQLWGLKIESNFERDYVRS